MYLEELMEETAWLELAKQIELCLSAAKKCRLQCQELLIPTHLSRRIARDMVGMAAREPCGLRGAVIHLSLDIDGVCTPLGKIAQDSSAPPTFELTLVLKADKSKCFNFRHFFNVGTYLPPGANKVLKQCRFPTGEKKTVLLRCSSDTGLLNCLSHFYSRDVF